MPKYKPGKLLRIFTDESGSPERFVEGVNSISDKYFVLCSVLIRQKEYIRFKEKLRKLGKKYHKYLKGKEIKSRSIRRSNPKNVDSESPPEYDFHKYSEGQEAYDNFADELKRIVSGTQFQIISVGTNKQTAQERYPKFNILMTLLGDMWERIALFHHVESIKSSYIVFDTTQKLTDNAIKIAYKNFVDNGSWYIAASDLAGLKLNKFICPINSESSCGVQLADYCAYPIKRYIEGKRTEFFKEVIAPKLYPQLIDEERGRRINMGLKISLNR